MNTRVKSIFKWSGRVLLFLILFLVLMLILLRIPAIQTKLGKFATNTISKQIDAELSIDRVAINFIDNVCLKGLYVEDQQGDTLLYAEKLNVDIGILRLLKRTVDVEKVVLENSVINIHQQEDEKFSFQFIIDAFTPENPKPKKEVKPFVIDIGTVELLNSDYSFDLLNARNDLAFDKLLISPKKLDLENLVFDLKTLAIENLVASSYWDERTVTNDIAEREFTNDIVSFPFKGFPVGINCDDLSINGSAKYEMGTNHKREQFDPKYIRASNINIQLKNVQLDSNRAKLDVSLIALDLNDKFSLQKLQTEIEFTPKEIGLNELVVKTEESNVNLSVKTKYDAFNELLRLNKTTDIDLKVNDFQVQPAEVAYFVPQINELDILKSYMEKDVILTADVEGNFNKVDINNFNLKIAQTNLKINGKAQNFTDINTLLLEDFQLNSTTNIKELRNLLGAKIIKEKYDYFGHIDLATKLNGTLKEMTVDHLDLKTDGQLALNLSGQVANLLEINDLSYDVAINNIQTGYSDFQVVVDSLPEMLAQLGSIHYNGQLKGGVSTYDLIGALTTSLGEVKTDLFLDFNKTFTNASYKGDISLDEFQLGNLLSNDSIGSITFNATIDGEGLALDSINTILDATIEQFSFNGYNYKDLKIDGKFIKREFNGFVNIEDENLIFDFEGLVDFNDSLPQLDFDAALNKFDGKALKLTNYPLQASLEITSDISGFSIKDISGSLTISDVLLKNEQEEWKTDSIVFLANNLEDRIREIHLNSTFANMDITGRYELEHLPKILLNFGDQFFPFSTMIGGNAKDDAVKEEVERSFSDERMKAKLVLKDLPELASFFKIDLQELDSVYMVFNLDAPTKLVDFEFFIPSVQYNSIYLDSFYVFAESKNEALEVVFRLDSINVMNTAYIPGINASAKFKDERANVSAFIKNDTGSYSLALHTLFTNNSDKILMQIQEPFVLNTKEWLVSQSADFEFSGESTTIPEISLAHNNEQLILKKIPEGYGVDFTSFNLNNIIELVEMDSTLIQGVMDGGLKLYTTEENIAVSGDLKIANIEVNDVNVGNLKLSASKQGTSAEAEIKLDGQENDVRIFADYDITEGVLDGIVDVNQFYLPTVAPFLQSVLQDLEGYLSGNLNLSGNPSKLDMNGALKFNEVSAKVNAVGTKYSISGGILDVSPKSISPRLTLKDNEGRNATLVGSIDHEYFSEFKFDLKFNTSAFTFLDSKDKEDELFFGKFVGSLNAEITGGIDLPVIRGSMAALDGTDITIQLLSPKAVANQESYVIFLDGGDYTIEDLDSIANERYTIKAGVDLNLAVSIDEDAITRLVIDPLTGDNLEIRGNSELTVKLPPYGDLDINGVYTVTEGFYRFSFQKFLKRQFELVNGSQINFTGQPMNAGLNLKASYKTEASAFSLVSDEAASLSEQEKKDVKKKTDVEVLLQVAGKLSEPELSFDVQLPESNNSPVGSSVTRALNRIKQNESELNKQVFSLLLLNSFTGSGSSGSISSSGTSTAMRSVGNLINTQLNRLASKAEGLQIDFDMDQYTDQLSESGEQITEIDLGVSQSLLNDRLIISIGTNVGLESGNQEQGALSNVAGDFVLSYKLTEDGRYTVRVFQKSDFDALNDANVWKTGAGFSYQTKFGNLRRNRKLKKADE